MDRQAEPRRDLPRGNSLADTPPEVQRQFVALLMQKSGQERLNMGFEMFDLARRLVIAGIQTAYPNCDERTLRTQIFLRFYGQDFSPQQREKILARILA